MAWDDEPRSEAASTQGNMADSENFSTAPTATENTPLLQSDTSSSRTLPDDEVSQEHHDAGSTNYKIGVKRGICIALSLWALIFLQASNMSGMVMAQSIIAAEFDAYEEVMWFTSSYLITVSSLAPLMGRLATIFAPGNMTLVTSVFFAVGAVVTSQAQSFTTFILGRVLIGVGGGGVMTLAMILVLELTDKRRRGLFIGLVNTGFTIGLSLGAVVFGALLPAIGWRALFWLQSPIGVLAGLGVYFSMPPHKASGSAKGKTTFQKLADIDYAGAVLLTVTIVLFLYGLSNKIQFLPILLSLISFILFILAETLLAPDPIIPLRILKSRGVLFSCLAQQGFMACRWTILYYSPIYVLAVRGLPAATAGSILIPTNLGFGLGGLAVGALHVRRAGSFYLPSLVSLLLFAAALWAVSLVSTATSAPGLYVGVLFANGLATGALLNYTLAHLLHLTRPADHFMATSLLATFRGFAGSFGTSIGGGAFMRALAARLSEGFERLDGGGGLGEGRRELVKRLVGSPALVFGGGLSEAERAVAVSGYEDALRVLYQGATAIGLAMVLFQASTGWTAPVVVDEEEVREAIVEHNGNMEA